MRRSFLSNIETYSKSSHLKKNIIRYCITNGENTLSEMGKAMQTSVPTITKLVAELKEDKYLLDFGKVETNGGRRPIIYGINPDSGYFIGVDIKQSRINIALINLKGENVFSKMNFPFKYENTPESLNSLCNTILQFIDNSNIDKNKILSVGVNIPGRVNTKTGQSISSYNFSEKPISEILQNRLELNVNIDNDSRAMAYGEYITNEYDFQNVLYINVSWELGLGMIINGKLYYGKSGFAGEFGHQPVFDNEIMCHCGKKGCLETEASGMAIHRKCLQKIKEGHSSILQNIYSTQKSITLEDIINAALDEDMLSIELIEEVGTILGKQLAGLINIFNPERMVIGGTVALSGDYLLLPLKSAIKKHSLNLVSRDTNIVLDKLADKAGVTGACMLARSKTLDFID